MCTVSWRIDADGYEVLFNRDELRTREVALPPRPQHTRSADAGRDVDFLAPIDPQGGGTWILVNSLGLTLCLTNGYRRPDDEEKTDWRSRGLLVRDLAACSEEDEVAAGVAGQVERHAFRSFQLLAFRAGRSPHGWRWDGGRESTLGHFEPTPPLSSSSFDPTGAETVRRQLFATLASQPTSAELLALHRAHDGGASALTPCMHRPEAHTVSLTRVVVDAATVSVAYAPGPPCRTQVEPALTLDRVGA